MAGAQEAEVAADRADAAQLRVTAIGTSNMLLRNAIRQPLESDQRISFRNLGIGASGSVLLGMRLDQAELDKSDVLVLEFGVNEENFVQENSSSHEAVTNAMRFAIDRACRAGCLPVLLLLPNLPFMDEGPAQQTMRTVFERAGLPVFDVSDIVRRAAAFAQVQPVTLFRDPKHLKPTVARAIGVLLIDALRSVPLDRLQPVRETGAPFRPIRFMPATDLVGRDHPALFERKTRLISAVGALLKAGEELVIPDLGGPASIVGVLANGARTRGLLESEDGEKLAFSVPDARWRDDKDAFVLIARPLPAVKVPRGGKRFRVVAGAGAKADEPAQIELCGFFLRSDDAPQRMAITPAPGRWRDLSARLDETAVRMVGTLALAED